MKSCPKCSTEHNKPGTFCSRACANSRGPRTEDFKNKVRAYLRENRVGFLKESQHPNDYAKNPRRCEVCSTAMPKYRGVGNNTPKTCSKVCASTLRSATLRRVLPGKCGGKRHGSGRGKQGYYQGIWCDSTYELAYLIYCLDHGIAIKRYSGYFEYEDTQGVRRKYYPDFEVNGEIVEIKGYVTDNVLRKVESVDRPIRLLTKDLLAPVFEYVTAKTGLSPLKYHTLYAPR